MPDPAPIPDEMPPPAENVGPVRFLWRADPQGRFIEVSPELAAIVGHRSAAVVGRSWDELRASSIGDPDALVANSFARRQTWSALAVTWSTDRGDRVAVDFAGMPVFGPDRELVGFRGFGLVRPAPPAVLAQPLRREAVAPAGVASPTPARGGSASWFSDIRQRLLAHLAGAKPEEPATALEPEPTAAVPVGEPGEGETGLSENEKSAFHEIARALGGQADLPGVAPPSVAPIQSNDDGRHVQALEAELAAREARLTDLEENLESAREELATLEEASASASARKADLLSRIADETRGPLDAIAAFSAGILEERLGALGSEGYKEYLKDIRSAALRVSGLIEDLAELARIEAGRFELVPTAANLNDLVGACVAEIQPRAMRERVVIRTSLGSGLSSALLDAGAIKQVLLNLLDRAVEAGEAGGQVIVSTAATDDGRVAVRVREAGSGLSEAELAAALEPFRRSFAKAPASFGLARAKAMVEANGGRFSASAGQGQGTLIEATFPAAGR